MNWFFTQRFRALWIVLVSSLAAGNFAKAQTITITRVLPAVLCPGSPVSVTFTTTGSFSATNKFTFFLSSETGNTASPTQVAEIASVPTSASTLTMTGTLPAASALPYGTQYKFWIRSSNPVKTSDFTVPGTIGVPKPTPGSSGVYTFCPNSGLQPITASGTNVEWYTDPGSTSAVSSSGTYNVRTDTSTPKTYYATQAVGSCRSDKVPINVNLPPPPANKPNVTYATSAYCPTTLPPALSASLNGGTSLRWYTSPGSATSATAPSPPTTTGLYSYTVVQLNSAGCEGPAEQFTIRVNEAAPGPPNVPDLNPAFCRTNLPATLSASPSGTGTSIFWTGPGITTPINSLTIALSSTAQSGTYQARQDNASGCRSQPRDVNVTINERPIVPGVQNLALCQNDAPQNLTATATGTLTWYVQGSNTPLPGTPRPSTSTPNSQTIYEVTQTDNKGCVSLKSAALTFSVRPLPVKPTLSGTYNYCEAQAPASLTANGNAIRWYSEGNAFLGSNTILSPKTEGRYSYKVTQTDGNGCQSEPESVTVNVRATPRPPTTGYDNNIALYCQGQATRPLAATGDNLLWSDTFNTPGTPQIPQPATTGRGDIPYYVTQTNAVGCTSSPLTVIARVNPTPGAPTSAQSRTYCAGENPTPLTATEPGVLWYTSITATGGTGSSSSPPISTAASNVGTPQLFYVSQTVANCESQQRQQVSVTVKRTPGAPDNISAPPFCQTYAPSSLSARAESGATLIWVNNGAETATAPVPPRDQARSYTYQVLQVLNGCRSAPAPVTVQVKPTPGQPGITPYSLCLGRESRALQVQGTELKYYDANDALLGTSAPSPSTAQSTTLTYKVTQSTDGCEGPKITYSVPVYAIPARPGFTQPKEYCAGETPSQLIGSGQSLLWYAAETGGTGNGQAPTPGTATSNVGSGQTFYVTQTVLGCESLRQAISVTVKRKPDLPTTQTTVEFCQTFEPPALTATPESGARIVWLLLTGESGLAPVPAKNAVDTYRYQVLQELNGCRSDQVTVTVRVKPTPGVPGITPFQLCQFSPGRALQVNGTELKFYDASNAPLGGTAPVVTTETPRTATYQVSQSTNGCEGPKITYSVVVQPKPAPPATQAVNYCVETASNPDQPKQTVQPLVAQGQNLQWFFVDGNPFPAGFVPVPSVGNTYAMDYRVTQTVNNCISDQGLLRVTVQANPAPIVSTSLVTYCRNDVARPLEATGANLRWIDPAGVLTDKTPTPPTENATKGGEAYQVYSISGSGCVSPRSTIRLVINTNPTLGLLGSTTINYGQTTPLRLRFTSSPPYNYTLTDGTSGVANDTLASVNVKPLQTTTYRVASVSNVCGNGLPGNPATATIFVNIPAITTTALTTATVCAGTSFAVTYTTSGTFNAGNAFKVQVADTLSKNYVDVSVAGLGGTLTANLPSTLKGGPYFVRVVATNPGAEVPGQPSPTVLTVRGLPAAMLVGTQSVFEGSPASLSVVLSGDGPWTISYGFTTEGSQPATSTFQTNANPHILSVQPPKTASYFLTAVSNNCSTGTISGTALVTVMPILAVENPLLTTVVLYPVPTQNLLTVMIDLPLTPGEPAQLTLRDLTGLPVLNRQTDTRQTTLDLSRQPAGLYMLSVQVGEHRVVRKVMKL